MSDTRGPITTVDNPHRFMTTIYVVSLAIIAMLSIVTHFVLQSVIEQQSKAAVYVNKSGQQRMLSQRASMFAIEYLKTGDEEAKALTISALKTMQDNHAFLIGRHLNAIQNNQPSPMSNQMQALYFDEPVNIDAQIKQFNAYVLAALENVSQTTGASNGAEKPFLKMAEEPFLVSLNSVVSQYENESLLDIYELGLAQNVVLTIVILTILLEALFVFRPMVSRVSQFAKQLQHEANYDHLSDIYNRRAFFMITDKLVQSAHRFEKAFSIILFDIDKFKTINDTYGHDVGDIVIREIAKLLTREFRSADIIARFGGEEFIVFLPETSINNAVLVAEKVRKAIENTPFSSNEVDLKVTMSAGVAEREDKNELDSIIKCADERLFKAKNNGRNQVCSAD